MFHLEQPVLALSLDAVVNIDDDTGLCGLLTLFSKCKEGLQDGVRLENMAWRLWNVERPPKIDCHSPALPSSPRLVASALASSSFSSSEDDSVDSQSEYEGWDHNQRVSSTAREDARERRDADYLQAAQPSPLAVPHGADLFRRHKKTRRLSSPDESTSHGRTLSSCRRTLSNTSFGQIMADLLPDKLDVRCQRRSSSQDRVSGRDHYVQNSPAPLDDSGFVPALRVEPDKTLGEPEANPVTPHSPQPEQTVRFPTVVIVNPTPHPTPPRTPQVSPPPSAPCSAIFAHTKRDTLVVSTRLPMVSSSPLPLTPESMEEKRDVEEQRLMLLAVPEAASASNKVHASASGQSTGNHVENASMNAKPEAAQQNSAISVAVRKNLTRPATTTAAPSTSLNLQERKFFIEQSDCLGGNSPDTSASSQMGSHSLHSAAVANKAVTAEAAAFVEPCSVVSRTSAATTHSHSSNASSSRSGPKIKSKKICPSNAKGKGKEPRHLVPAVQRAHMFVRHMKHAVDATGAAGTIQRSKVGGRVGVAAAAVVGARMQSQLRHQAPTPTLTPAPLPQSAAQPPTATKAAAAKDTGVEREETSSKASSSRVGASHRRVASQSKCSSSSTKNHALNASAHAKANAVIPASKGRIELADDSDFWTEDEEWDTEDASDAEQSGQMKNGKGKEAPKADVERKLAEAAAEAQRQRDMFAKLDRRSYTNLNRSRSGLLSSLFHPDPNLFPSDHPYRHSRSTQDILAHLNRPHYQPTALQATKGSAAVPVAASVNAEGVGSPHDGRKRSPLRLKGKPEGVEESDTGEDDEENKVPVSTSVAEQRLAALYKGKRPVPQPQQTRTHTRTHTQTQTQTQLEQHQPHRQLSLQPTQPTQGGLYNARGADGRPPLARVSTAPIALCYPYNLPPPMPPSTPRTTRRLMLTHELPESLRRNLLWERQVSKQRPMGLNRRSATTGSQPAGTGVHPLRPPVMSGHNVSGGSGSGGGGAVRAGAQSQGSAAATEGHSSNGTQGSGGIDEARKQRARARDRSWANNFHAAGW